MRYVSELEEVDHAKPQHKRCESLSELEEVEYIVPNIKEGNDSPKKKLQGLSGLQLIDETNSLSEDDSHNLNMSHENSATMDAIHASEKKRMLIEDLDAEQNDCRLSGDGDLDDLDLDMNMA